MVPTGSIPLSSFPRAAWERKLESALTLSNPEVFLKLKNGFE
jgi:hypothetical protein